MEKELTSSPSIGKLLNVHFVYNLDTRTWAYTDGRLTEITGVLPAEAPQLLKMIEPDDQVMVHMAYKQLQENKLLSPLRLRVKGRDGYHWIELSAIQLELSGTNCLIGTVYDITADMEHEAELAKYANKKNSILHMLSHDLRGPLSVAGSLAKSLRKDFADEAAQQKIEAISGMISQAIDLIVDLTKREFLDTTEVALVIKPTNLAEALAQYIAECRLSATLAERHFHFHSETDHLMVAIDEPKFMQVMNNLVSNALKFTHPGGNIRITLGQDGDWVIVTVSDDGIGIPEDLQPFVFERYSRARREGIQGEPTEGVGLSIVHAILAWHGAEISCKSKEGKGTTFIIRLPGFRQT
ncbi:PAS domain-containing sensor histidine kinase [Pedobacter yulinensis]|nr:PAS domain-containing sensor histidine kinase [Pedobacter yulinensis]